MSPLAHTMTPLRYHWHLRGQSLATLEAINPDDLPATHHRELLAVLRLKRARPWMRDAAGLE